MIDNNVVADICEKIGSAQAVQTPSRYVDYPLASSFAHCTGNVTADEVLGYALIDRVRERLEGISSFLLQDYDGTHPDKEKPCAGHFQNLLKDEQNCSPYIPLHTDFGRTIENQSFYRDPLLNSLDKSWEQLIKTSGFERSKRQFVKERFDDLAKILYETVIASKSHLEFVQQIRKKFLSLAGISSFGVPESRVRALHAQKLEEDLEAGFPFWRMDLPDSFREKHMDNKNTYLFYVKSDEGYRFSVKFFTDPERFEFDRNGQRETLRAEESIDAMRKGILIPTISILNYVSLSPARKPTNLEIGQRIHLAGQYMAGERGYAHELVEAFNRVPGYDRVSLVCTGYDGSLAVETKKLGTFIGFGAVYPQFGKQGIQKSLREGKPHVLQRQEVYSETDDSRS